MSLRRTGLLPLIGLVIALSAAVGCPRLGQADSSTAPWSAPAIVAKNLATAAMPVLTQTGDGTTHAIWEMNSKIYHAQQPLGGSWSNPRVIATGGSPAAIVASDGRLHVIFQNEFNENYDIYHVFYRSGGWSWPVNISNTTGGSYSPALAAGKDGRLYAAWQDSSTGDWVIHYSSWDGVYWSSSPVPNTRGQSPAVATNSNGTLFVVWQERLPTTYNIYFVELTDGTWTLPINVSDRTGIHAIGAQVTSAVDQRAHLTWIENAQTVRYAFGEGEINWPWPQTVAQTETVAERARIAAAAQGPLYIVWEEGDWVRVTSATAGPPSWPIPETLSMEPGSVSDVSLTVTPRGPLLTWVHTSPATGTEIYFSRQVPGSRHHQWLPLPIAR